MFRFAERARPGDKVFTVGNIHGEGIAIRDGLVASETEDPSNPEIKHVRFSAGASPGNSGGPLLNSRGEVVGLISQKTNAENYNIATRVADLKAAIQKFVGKSQKQVLVLDAKSLPVLKNPVAVGFVAESMKIPFPGADRFRLDDEHFGELKSFKIKVGVPASLKEVSSSVQSSLAVVMLEAFKKEKQKAARSGKPGSTWEEQVTAELPVLIPLPGDDKTQLSVKDGRIRFRNHGPFFHSGSTDYEMLVSAIKHDKENSGASLFQYNFSASTPSTRPVTTAKLKEHQKKMKYSLYSNEYGSDEPKNLTGGLASRSIELDFVFAEGASVEDKRVTVLDALEAWAIGKEGANVSLARFQFLRPDAKSTFKITKLPKPFALRSSHKDKLGRQWHLFSTDIYTLSELNFICLDAVNEYFCQSVRSAYYESSLPEAAIRNFVEFSLSEQRDFLNFFPAETLKGKGNLGDFTGRAELADFDWAVTDGVLSVTLKSAGKTLKVGDVKTIHQVRFIPGLVHDAATAKGQWKAFAVEPLQAAGRTHLNCTAGIDFEDFHYLASAVDIGSQACSKMGELASESERKIRAQPKHKQHFWRKRMKADFFGRKAEAFGVCNELVEVGKKRNSSTVTGSVPGVQKDFDRCRPRAASMGASR